MLPREGRALDSERILTEAQNALPGTTSVGNPSEGLYPLLGKDGEATGWVTSTFPQAQDIMGYSGASELLVLFDPDRTVKAVLFLSSQNTDGHVAKIRDDPAFWAQWNGKPEARLGAAPGPVIVSGATLTSEAMARGLAARFGAQGTDQWFPERLKLSDLEKWFPEADAITDGDYPGSRSVRKPAGTGIDLSAIGKGFAVDRVGEKLRELGITDFVFELGGEVLAGDGEWEVEIEKPDPASRTTLRTVKLKNQALATSGNYRQFKPDPAGLASHIIDPRTSKPVIRPASSVSVIAKDCATADAWATALFVLGPNVPTPEGLEVTWNTLKKPD